MEDKPEFWITANSPGEIAGWLKPVAKRLKARLPHHTLKVILLPCTFATGHEAAVARALPGVDEVLPVAALSRLISKPGTQKPAGLLHLGGDLMYAAWLVRQFGMPAWAYQWARRSFDRYFTGYMVKIEKDRERLLRQGIADSKIHVVGDLVADAVADAVGSNGEATPLGGRLITFLCGSRQREVEVMLPFFLEVAARIRERFPDALFQTQLSPFLQPLPEVMQPIPRMGGRVGKRAGEALVAEDGTAIRLLDRPDVRAVAPSTLVVTIPGTKTAEAACLGIPMVVLLPLNLPEDIPSFGLVGLLDYIPFGRWLKGALVPKMARRVGFVAQPNILAGRVVVPEMVGRLSAPEVAERVCCCLQESPALTQMATELRALYAPSLRSADRFVDVIAQALREA